MKWEEINSDKFAQAVIDCQGVCILSLAVMERHGPHMPVGTDMIDGLHICSEAAKHEPAVVFPPWFLGQVYESSCFPGAITVPPGMLVDLLMHILDEIGRNGFTKIILYVSHGGNKFLAPFLAESQLQRPKPYQVYVTDFMAGQTPEEMRVWQKALETKEFGHACEMETSMLLAHRPDLVNMKALTADFHTLGRLSHVMQHGFNGFYWFGEYPTNYVGDSRPATAEKGRVINESFIRSLARFIKIVKDDKAAHALAAEFFGKERGIRGP